jgi:hypothetical protein
MPIKDKKFNAISQYNTRYRLERWQTPQGGTLIGQLPGSVKGFMRFCLFLWAICHKLTRLPQLGVDFHQNSTCCVSNRLIFWA